MLQKSHCDSPKQKLHSNLSKSALRIHNSIGTIKTDSSEYAVSSRVLGSHQVSNTFVFARMLGNLKTLMRGFSEMATEPTFLLNTNFATFGGSSHGQTPVSSHLLRVLNSSANNMQRK